jgi:hypothetical protein
LARRLSFGEPSDFFCSRRRFDRVARAALFQYRTERAGQFLDIGLKSRGRNLGPLPPRETLQALGQFARFGHGRAVDEDRDDVNIALERRFDLDPDEIVRIVEPAQTVLVGSRNPVFSNDRDKRVAGADPLAKDIKPINTKVDVVDIEKQVFQSLGQAIADCARGERGLFPPIADEDAARHFYALAA